MTGLFIWEKLADSFHDTVFQRVCVCACVCVECIIGSLASSRALVNSLHMWKALSAVSYGDETKLVQLEYLTGWSLSRALNISAYCAAFDQPVNLDV